MPQELEKSFSISCFNYLLEHVNSIEFKYFFFYSVTNPLKHFHIFLYFLFCNHNRLEILVLPLGILYKNIPPTIEIFITFQIRNAKREEKLKNTKKKEKHKTLHYYVSVSHTYGC